MASLVSVAALLALTVMPLGSASRDWPPFLRASAEYPAHITNAVRRLWTEATFTRTVSADPAPVPLGFYLRFVDAPDLTAAAARHLRLTTYDVKVLGEDWYGVENGDSVQGVYRVLERAGGRRVLLSWGTHRGSILGTVGGSALTRLEFGDEGGRAAQRLVVSVIVDNGVAAGLTRAIVPLFGWFVDRKLAEAFRTTAAAAAWAHAKPDEFCAWLDGAFRADRRGELLEVFDECQPLSAAGVMGPRFVKSVCAIRGDPALRVNRAAVVLHKPEGEHSSQIRSLTEETRLHDCPQSAVALLVPDECHGVVT